MFVDHLLPLVHCVWKPFVHRFSDEEPLVTIKVIRAVIFFTLLALFIQLSSGDIRQTALAYGKSSSAWVLLDRGG